MIEYNPIQQKITIYKISFNIGCKNEAKATPSNVAITRLKTCPKSPNMVTTHGFSLFA